MTGLPPLLRSLLGQYAQSKQQLAFRGVPSRLDTEAPLNLKQVGCWGVFFLEIEQQYAPAVRVTCCFFSLPVKRAPGVMLSALLRLRFKCREAWLKCSSSACPCFALTPLECPPITAGQSHGMC